MRTFVFVLALVALTSAGCASRFSSLHSGNYECTATLTSSTCAEVLPASSAYPTELVGGGSDIVSIDMPSEASRFHGDVSLQTFQFGAQSDTMAYGYSSNATCMPAVGTTPATDAPIVVLARITLMGTDALDVHITNDYPDYRACTAPTPATSGPCQIVWDVHCAIAP
jgi:hypothetical protein